MRAFCSIVSNSCKKLTFYYLHFNEILIPIATARMIKNVYFLTSMHSATMYWTTPEFLPQHYKLNVTCNYFCSPVTQIIYQRIFTYAVAFSEHTSGVTIPRLRPAMDCIVHFKSVYNVAAIDSGLFSYFATRTTTINLCFLRT